MRAYHFLLLSLCLFNSLQACKEDKNIKLAKNDTADTLKTKKPEAPVFEAPVFTYHFEQKAIWKTKDSFEGYAHKNLLAAINRVDVRHLQRLDSILVPDKYIDTIEYYLPFPHQAEALKDIKKIILFSYPSQTFGAYEYGKLIISGPTNMGKKASKTPTGLFFCNWKAKEIRSTVDNDWILKWNFNISNFGGVGFHQYDLPGYPVSHSCMRLWAEQAEFLYYWAEQWKLSEGKIRANGTPVVVFGEYPFGQPRPWFALAKDAKALNISNEQIAAILDPYADKIMEAQETREALYPTLQDTSVSLVQ